MTSFCQDLDEDVVITLAAKNPQAPKNKVRFDHTSGEFSNVKVVEAMFDQLEIESTILHKESEEAQKQMEVKGFYFGHKLLDNFFIATLEFPSKHVLNTPENIEMLTT